MNNRELKNQAIFLGKISFTYNFYKTILHFTLPSCTQERFVAANDKSCIIRRNLTLLKV
jgi:hypothetical protein